MSASRWTLAAVLVLAVASVVAPGCATNPVTGRRELSLVSPAQEIELGKQGNAAVVAEYGVYAHPQLQALVSRVGQKLAAASHMPDLEWHFTLVDDPVVNAFALPGGYIYVTRGIVAHFGSEAQLAGVLGHEIGHVTARHSAGRITQQQLAGLGLGVASIFSETVRQYGQAAQTALGLLFLKYGREDENEADQLGVDYSVKGGYDAREMVETYATLQRIGAASGQSLPTFLSSHPDPGDRRTRVAELSRTAVQGKSNLIVNRNGFVDGLDGILFGRDPRQGYFADQQYFHPEMRFSFRVPTGWKAADTRQSVLMQNGEQAVMQLSLARGNPASPRAMVDELLRQGAITDAQGRDESVGGFPAWIGKVLASRGEGQQPVTLLAGFIDYGDRMFQFLGQTATAGDANESAIFSTMRSFRRLDDAARLNVTPDVIDVVTVSSATTLSQLIAQRGVSGVNANEVAILNGLDGPEERLAAGAKVKLVVPGRR